MELRALWLLCCCFCCCGRAADPRATFTATEPRSRERQAAAFRESLHRHRYLNSVFPGENSSAVYGINQFSHLFPEEFKAIYLRSKPSRLPRYRAEVQTSIPNVSLPLRFDWRDKRVVTQVRNQQTCGGCWAFSVVGAVESAYAIKGKPLEDLSVQQVIDCSYNNYGCNGGSTLNALNWLNKTHVKLVRDSEYPFKAQNGLCRYFSDSHSGFSIKGYSAYDFRNTVIEYIKCTKKWVNPLLMLSASLPVNSRLLFWGVKSCMWTFDYVEVWHPYPWVHDDFSHLLESLDSSVTEMTPVCSWNLNLAMWNFTDYTLPVPSDQEDEMAKALVTFGPLVVVVDAVSWQDYLGGIIQHHCSSGEANHAVLITGFDKIGNTPYWIVRNSWGSSWGVDGYAHVKMGGNICGIADSVSAVFV